MPTTIIILFLLLCSALSDKQRKVSEIMIKEYSHRCVLHSNPTSLFRTHSLLRLLQLSFAVSLIRPSCADLFISICEQQHAQLIEWYNKRVELVELRIVTQVNTTRKHWPNDLIMSTEGHTWGHTDTTTSKQSHHLFESTQHKHKSRQKSTEYST